MTRRLRDISSCRAHDHWTGGPLGRGRGHSRPASPQLLAATSATAGELGICGGRYTLTATMPAAKMIGTIRSALLVALGTISCISCNRLGPSSTFIRVASVRLPPGRARLETSPSATGSLDIVKTMGIVVVAALAASAECWPQQLLSPGGELVLPPGSAIDRSAPRPSGPLSQSSYPATTRTSARSIGTGELSAGGRRFGASLHSLGA
jgi:hypothetical protein